MILVGGDHHHGPGIVDTFQAGHGMNEEILELGIVLEGSLYHQIGVTGHQQYILHERMGGDGIGYVVNLGGIHMKQDQGVDKALAIECGEYLIVFHGLARTIRFRGRNVRLRFGSFGGFGQSLIS